MDNQVMATYESDSKRFHRFQIDEGQGISGTVYIPKGKEIPAKLTIFLKTKAEKERLKENTTGI
jgi:hypothetical protein